MGLATDLLLLAIIILLIVIFWSRIEAVVQVATAVITNSHIGSGFNFPNSTQTSNTKNIGIGSLENYTLSLINKDRSEYGLSNVTIAPTPSGQQHANNMLQYSYFSHWDIYGIKPYMRYTILGGNGSMQENVAYTKSGVKACIGSLCTSYGNINVTAALAQMEYNMMYNDSVCCNNGHRDNILNPYHNEVSIGIAYNSSSVYLVEDFINNYISWLNSTPRIIGNEIILEGNIAPGYKLSTIEMIYDPPVSQMSVAQLDNTSEYSYGQAAAGIVSNPFDYYPSLITINADRYYVEGNDFFIEFNNSKVVRKYGAGEYTVALWLNGTATNGSFIGSTYTIFIDPNGNVYTPSNV